MRDEAFQVVPMHVARNPVARAIAMAKMRDAVRTFQLRLYFIPYDAQVLGDVHCAMQVLTVCLFSLEELDQLDSPDVRVMRGAQHALLQCAGRKGAWRPIDAPAIDTGLQRAVEAFATLPATVTARAWQRMRQIEEDVGLHAGTTQENAR